MTTLPQVGATIRITRTHTTGSIITGEGVVLDVNESGGLVMPGESYWNVRTEADGWAVTWEELAPPAPVLPPVPEPGFYLDAQGNCWQIASARWIAQPGDEVATDWETAHRYGPFSRLYPAAEVAELVDRLRAVSLVLIAEVVEQCGHWRYPNGVEGTPAPADYDTCQSEGCTNAREALAPVADLLARFPEVDK